MGLFDTVHVSDPIRPAEYDKLVTEIQTKEFGNARRDSNRAHAPPKPK